MLKKEIDIPTSMSSDFMNLILSSVWPHALWLCVIIGPVWALMLSLSYFLIEKPAMRCGRCLSRRTSGSSIGAKEAA